MADSGDVSLGPQIRPPLSRAPVFAALDLGTNNCRLLIAAPAGRSFRVLEAYSRIVRLGEGLSLTGRLSDQAMDRAVAALKVCADRVARRGAKLRGVATQACRIASNGEFFVRRVEQETGLRLEIIDAEQEARLSVAGCLNLIDHDIETALVLDVGGGSTEVSWLDVAALRSGACNGAHPDRIPIAASVSIPVGVVTLAEQFPETEPRDVWYRAMVDAVKARLADFQAAHRYCPVFQAGRGHIIGTSGAITSLAGIHLRLDRYERAKVDGLWMTSEECSAAADYLLSLSLQGRASQPCIGPDRADLVLAGAAILQAVQELWPARRLRVADRGLREGLIMSLITRRNTRGSRGGRRRSDS